MVMWHISSYTTGLVAHNSINRWLYGT